MLQSRSHVPGLILVWMFALLAIPAGAGAATNCDLSNYTKLSTMTACLGAGSSCTISTPVYVDTNFTRVSGSQPLGSITIGSGGALAFPNASRRVEVGDIIVDGGTLQVGATACPISEANLTELDFYGTNPGTLTCAAKTDTNASPFNKGICFVSGTLSIVGAKGVQSITTTNRQLINGLVGLGGIVSNVLRGAAATPGTSWTYLRCPAGPTNMYGAGNGLAAPVQGSTGTCPGSATTLALQGKSGWAENDWIVVGGTGYADDEAEFVQIALISPGIDGNDTVMLKTPLVHYHFGSAAPSSATGRCVAGDGKTVEPASFCADATLNYGVDERAEVGLISRTVLLSGRQAWEARARYETGATIVETASTGQTAQTFVFQATTPGTSGTAIPSFPTTVGETVGDGSVVWTNKGNIGAAGDIHWGGEIRLLPGAAAANSVKIEGAELEEFGKDQLSSYPIHFHMLGMVPSMAEGGPVVAYNSIHHSYNKCITVHMSDGVAITGNVCARIVGHMFYLESGKETANTFTDNLGLGAMNNALSISNTEKTFFWSGDNMASNSLRPLSYDEFNIPYSEDPSVPHNGPSSGFWISNANNNFTGNSIGGCQGSGVGYWYEESTFSQFQPFGAFNNNRTHGCQYGLLTVDDLGNVVNGSTYPKVNPTPHKGGTVPGADLLAFINGITATRIRDRGIWVRPGWYHVRNARLAGDRDALSMVTGGGPEGIAPGVWGLTSDSVIVGISQNNPDRFGPSQCFNPKPPGGQETGCVGEPYQPAVNKGYPSPNWNLGGVMFYDGPARLKNIRFVNFKQNPLSELTKADQSNLAIYTSALPNNYKGFAVYEGDAAISWFQSNVNVYPPTQSSEGLSWDNVDFKHQVYTQQVNLAPFVDGDKNTAILDRDGTLGGYGVIDASGHSLAAQGRFPISLNNLPVNAVTDQSVTGKTPPDSADECHAEGLQDAVTAPSGGSKNGEGRQTAMMSAGSYATLEVTNLKGNLQAGATSGFLNDDLVTLTKDEIDYPGVDLADQTTYEWGPNHGMTVKRDCVVGHGCMVLTGRNQQGVYEPKVESGLGYTLASADGFPGFINATSGSTSASPYISIGFTDAILPVNSAGTHSPFSIRMGVCFEDTNGHHPAGLSSFQVLQGRKSYGSPTGNPPTLTADWVDLSKANQSGLPTLSRYCGQLDNTYLGPTFLYPNIDPTAGCPAAEPSGSGQPGQGAVITLTGVQITSPSQMPATLDPTKFYYDATTGMLYLQIEQTELNAQGESPIGSCTTSPKDPACPTDEHFYPCPKNGCSLYTIRITDNSYTPNSASGCAPYDPTTGNTVYNHGVWDAYPSGLDQLAYIVPSNAMDEPNRGNNLDANTKNGEAALITPVFPNLVSGENYPFNGFGANGAPWCPENRSLTAFAVAANSHPHRRHHHRRLATHGHPHRLEPLARN